MTVYTLGRWTAKAGREDDFVRLWTRLAERTVADFPAAHGTLVRDRDDPRRFVSFGPWDSLEEVERWRASPAFTEAVAELREVLDDFVPGTFDLVTEIGG